MDAGEALPVPGDHCTLLPCQAGPVFTREAATPWSSGGFQSKSLPQRGGKLTLKPEARLYLDPGALSCGDTAADVVSIYSIGQGRVKHVESLLLAFRSAV